MTEQPLIPIGRVRLTDFDPDDTGGYTKERAEAEIDQLRERLEDLQAMLYSQGEKSLLVMLQAMDTGGKDSTIKKVFEGLNPVGVQVTSFKTPSDEELGHDFLWRIHQHTPRRGMIAIFNRSHYEDVLIVRVNQLVPEAVWRGRYDQINHFEQHLTENNTRILKFYLHISKDEQKRRLQDRLDDPTKHWKFSIGDLPVREKWDDYMTAYEDALTACNTVFAPWHIVPANRKWYRNLVVTRAIVEALEQMGLAFPPPEPGLDQVVIPD
jgi:PPK2 family polyphosphate:nucleotide phosphotransferase